MSQKLRQRKPLRSEKTAVIIYNKDDTEKIFELVEFEIEEEAKSFFEKMALEKLDFSEVEDKWKAVVNAVKNFNYFGYGSCTSPTSKATLTISRIKAPDDDKESI